MCTWHALPHRCAGRSEAQKPDGSYRVSGVVIHALTGSPIPQARVAIGPVDQTGTETASMTTGGDGRFAFDGLRAGKGSLFAERKGFVRQAYPSRGPSESRL